jgi:hypothetical protein
MSAPLTPDEQAILDSLVSAWNGFMALPRVHSDELCEFRHKLHDLQRIVMVRPAIEQRQASNIKLL